MVHEVFGDFGGGLALGDEVVAGAEPGSEFHKRKMGHFLFSFFFKKFLKEKSKKSQ